MQINKSKLKIKMIENNIYYQKDLADKIGVDRISLNRWLRGACEPKTESFYKLITVLHLNQKEIDEIFFGLGS